MFFKVITTFVWVVLVVAVATIASPDVYEPVYYPAPIPYYFDYKVHDAYGGSHYRSEVSDGYHKHGQYNVYYPGGSTQTRKY